MSRKYFRALMLLYAAFVAASAAAAFPPGGYAQELGAALDTIQRRPSWKCGAQLNRLTYSEHGTRRRTG